MLFEDEKSRRSGESSRKLIARFHSDLCSFSLFNFLPGSDRIGSDHLVLVLGKESNYDFARFCFNSINQKVPLLPFESLRYSSHQGRRKKKKERRRLEE